MAEMLPNLQQWERGPKVVAIGGGTGLSTMLRGLKKYTKNLTAVVTVADEDKDEVLPLVKRFSRLGYNIAATFGTAEKLKAHGIRVRVLGKLSEGSDEILQTIRRGEASYILNTRAINSGIHYKDGYAIRRCAVENNVTMFTSLDTVRMLLGTLEEISFSVSTIDEQ